jgi:Tfp pilus assembly protein PilO
VRRRTFLLAFAAAGVLLVLWFLLLWGPQGGRLKDAEDRQSAAEAANTALQVRLSRLQASQARAPELTADLEQLRRAVPDGPELAQFILDANDAASAAGVDFLSISPGVPEQSDPALPPVINLAINVTGSYFSVLDYLDRLAELPRIVVIDDITLTPNDSESGRSLGVSITGRMFATTAPQVTPVSTTTTTAPGAAGEQVTTSTSAPPEITVSSTNG